MSENINFLPQEVKEKKERQTHEKYKAALVPLIIVLPLLILGAIVVYYLTVARALADTQDKKGQLEAMLASKTSLKLSLADLKSRAQNFNLILGNRAINSQVIKDVISFTPSEVVVEQLMSDTTGLRLEGVAPSFEIVANFIKSGLASVKTNPEFSFSDILLSSASLDSATNRVKFSLILKWRDLKTQ
jgi:Tfp pilus assembly protein PilN